jgi:putative transposase
MPRAPRWVLTDLPLHIVQRGINRNSCFFSEADYATYLHYLGVFAARFDCSVHAYCLMTNHVHLLVTPHAAEACALFMKNLSQCYVQTVNKRLERTGTLWGGRFRSCPVRSDYYVLACYRYIELNPVRAGMVAAAAEYRWSSYLANAEGETSSSLLRPHSAYEALGDDRRKRAEAYRALCESAPSPIVAEEIRKATRVGHVVGTRRRSRGRPPVQMRKMGSVPILGFDQDEPGS